MLDEQGKDLPIETLRADFVAELPRGRVVVSAPTGSGKSTQVPRWCAVEGRVLVVEPRRVACRGLASWVAELEASTLGDRVGYVVRDDRRAGDNTEIVFATPGVVLRMLEGGDLSAFTTVIIDEFHERSLDVDLLLALLLERFQGKLVVMSATLAGDRVAQHIQGKHLKGEGRAYPVDLKYISGKLNAPDIRGVEDRLQIALEQALNREGDILVFLPGKGEIAKASQVAKSFSGLEVLELHGGLNLQEQARIFDPGRRRRVILATNVAETSLTVPRIGVVIDSGLVRQTRYHNDQGFLTLVPIAQDSAEQRRGRAGRLGPGICYRLWSEGGRLAPQTTPEVYREALEPFLLAIIACGGVAEKLPFLDPPKEHALETARDYLRALQAMDEDGGVTEMGKDLFGLPLDTAHGRLLIEADRSGCLGAFIDVVSVLSVGRPLFVKPIHEGDENDPRAAGCDAIAIIRAMRRGEPRQDGLNPFVFREATQIGKRLRAIWGLGAEDDGKVPEIRVLAETAMRADTRCVHIARRRKARVTWSAGGTEVELGRDSAVNEREVEAMAVLDTHAVGMNLRQTRLLATCAIPMQLKWLVSAGVGEDSLGNVFVEKGRLVANMDRSYAGKMIHSREAIPEGRLAREALLKILVEGKLYRREIEESRDRFSAARLWHALDGAKLVDQSAVWEEVEASTSVEGAFEGWLETRVEELGLESGEDLALLEAEDFLFPMLPEGARLWMDKKYPRFFAAEEDRYEAVYELEKRWVTVHHISGRRKDPPAKFYLPPFPTLKVKFQHRGRTITLRE